MQQKSKYLLASIAAVAAIGLITSVGVGFATSGSDEGLAKEDWKAQKMEKQEQMKEIMDNGDYEAWQTAMNEKVDMMLEKAEKFEASINQETFENMQQVHSLMQEGKYDEAKELAGELDLPMGHKAGLGGKHMKGGMNGGCQFQK